MTGGFKAAHIDTDLGDDHLGGSELTPGMPFSISRATRKGSTLPSDFAG